MRPLLYLVWLGCAACGGDDDDDAAGDADADADADADSDGDACVDLCTDAQAGDCTSITGDCGDFCTALTSIEGPSGCGDERGQYESCLELTGACGGRCDGQETLLTRCVTTWCETQPGNASCQTLLGSFQ
jgi:hypothetical protein